MINRKCNCENKVSSQKLAVLTASSGKAVFAKTYNFFEKIRVS